MTRQKEPHHHTRRDAETLRALGYFIVALAIPVLIGTYFAFQSHKSHAVVVNVIAGVILLSIGVGFVLRGHWTLRHLDE